MAEAFAWIDGEMATEDEKADAADMLTAWNDINRSSTPPQRRTTTGTLHIDGEHKGQVYVSGPRVAVEAIDGDYSAMYRAALEALLAEDERVRAGHAFRIGII